MANRSKGDFYENNQYVSNPTSAQNTSILLEIYSILQMVQNKIAIRLLLKTVAQ